MCLFSGPHGFVPALFLLAGICPSWRVCGYEECSRTHNCESNYENCYNVTCVNNRKNARGQFPFTYLGLPLGIYKPTVEQCLPIVNRIAKRIASISTFMTQAGNVLLVKSMLASLAVYFMFCLDIPITIKHQIIKYLRHCLWRSPDMEDRRPALVAWHTVCRPKN